MCCPILVGRFILACKFKMFVFSSLALSPVIGCWLLVLFVCCTIISGQCKNEPLFMYSDMKLLIHITMHNLPFLNIQTWLDCIFYRSLLRSAFHFFLHRCVCLFIFLFLHEFCLSKTHWPMRVFLFVCVSVYLLQKSRWLRLLSCSSQVWVSARTFLFSRSIAFLTVRIAIKLHTNGQVICAHKQTITD